MAELCPSEKAQVICCLIQGLFPTVQSTELGSRSSISSKFLAVIIHLPLGGPWLVVDIENIDKGKIEDPEMGFGSTPYTSGVPLREPFFSELLFS